MRRNLFLTIFRVFPNRHHSSLLPAALGTKAFGKPKSAHQSKQLNTYGDFLADAIGPARITHPKEYNAILKEANALGIEVEFRPGTLAYSPSLSRGKPGTLVLDPDASIGAMRHELRHAKDDKDSGYLGFGNMENPSNFWRFEFRGYMEEIKVARELKLFDVGKKIVEEMRERRAEIKGDN